MVQVETWGAFTLKLSKALSLSLCILYMYVCSQNVPLRVEDEVLSWELYSQHGWWSVVQGWCCSGNLSGDVLSPLPRLPGLSINLMHRLNKITVIWGLHLYICPWCSFPDLWWQTPGSFLSRPYPRFVFARTAITSFIVPIFSFRPSAFWSFLTCGHT